MKLHINIDRLISLMLVFSFFISSITGIIFASQAIWSRGVINIFFLISRFVFLSLGIGLVFTRKMSKVWLAFLGTSFFIISLSGVFFIENIPYIAITLQKYIPMAFTTLIIINIKDYDFLLKLFNLFSSIVSFILFIFIFYLIKNNLIYLFASEETYMLFSYSLLPFVCFLLYSYLNNKSLYSLINFIFTAIIMIIFGCRGATLCLLAYFIIIFIQKNINEHRYKKIAFCLLLGITLIFITFMKLEYINSFFYNELNIKSRLLRKISSGGDINSISTGRLSIYKKVINELDYNFIKVRGVNSDSVLNGGIYCHNIFLEILYDFGGIIGGFLCVILFYFIYKTIVLRNKSILNDLIQIFFAIGFFKLLVSSSLFYETNFWCWIALIMKKIKFFTNNKT